MKKLTLILVLVVLAVSACDNNLPPTKAPGGDQNPQAASNPAANTDAPGK